MVSEQNEIDLNRLCSLKDDEIEKKEKRIMQLKQKPDLLEKEL